MFKLLSSLLFFISTSTALIKDCDTNSQFKLTELALYPDPPVKGQNVYMTVIFDNPGEEITDGDVVTSVSLNGIPFSPSHKTLCSDTICPLTTGINNRSTASVWPETVSGKINSKIQWFDTNGKSLLCIQTSVAVKSDYEPVPKNKSLVERSLFTDKHHDAPRPNPHPHHDNPPQPTPHHNNPAPPPAPHHSDAPKPPVTPPKPKHSDEPEPTHSEKPQPAPHSHKKNKSHTKKHKHSDSPITPPVPKHSVQPTQTTGTTGSNSGFTSGITASGGTGTSSGTSASTTSGSGSGGTGTSSGTSASTTSGSGSGGTGTTSGGTGTPINNQPGITIYIKNIVKGFLRGSSDDSGSSQQQSSNTTPQTYSLRKHRNTHRK
jgi:hypothetical protein